MSNDFEDLHDLDDLSDDELRAVVLEHLGSHPGLDVDDLTVTVEDGIVCLGGRVGTEEELRMAERVVIDTLGVDRFESELVVDPIRRPEAPIAIDDQLVEEERESGLLLGDHPRPLEPTVDEVEEDLDARLFGTADVQKAIADGTAWIPPQSPTPEGLGGRIAPDVDDI
jgi:hypothetical protein